jgi:hypothetical protein
MKPAGAEPSHGTNGQRIAVAVDPRYFGSVRLCLSSTYRRLTTTRSDHCKNHEDHYRQMNAQSGHCDRPFSKPNDLYQRANQPNQSQ